MTARLAWDISKGTVSEFMEDSVPRLAAALAYYAMFSLGPLLVIVIAVAGMFFEKGAVRHEAIQQVQSMMGPQAAETLQTMQSTQSHGRSLVATIVGTIALLLGASGVFGQLQDSLNTIWEVKPKPGQGIWGFIRSRFLSFTMVLGIGFLLLISMVITTALEAFSGMITHGSNMPEFAVKALHFGISFIVITLLFAMIYKVLPDVKVKWRDVWVGAIGTALLFTLGKFALGMYLGRQSTASAYGAAGSVVLILLWVYYSSLILFFGAEFTQVYAKKTGSRIEPSPNAVRVSEEKRAEEGIPHDEGGKKGSSAGQPEQQPPGEPAYAYSNGSDGEEMDVPARNGKKPLSVLASAAGAGFVSGWIAHRRFSKRGE